MKQMISLVLAVLVTQTIAVPAAQAFDVLGTTTAIVIDKTREGKLTFKLCSLPTRKCEQLGKASGYTIEELKRQRVQEYLEASGVTVAAVGAAVAAPLVWGFGSILGLAAVMTTGATTIPLIITFGGTAAAATGSVVAGFSAVKQFKQTQVLSDDIIKDVDFNESDKKIARFAEDLKTVLEKI